MEGVEWRMEGVEYRGWRVWRSMEGGGCGVEGGRCGGVCGWKGVLWVRCVEGGRR